VESAGAAAADAAGALPCRKAGNQVVFVRTEKCTRRDTTATTERKNGIPKDGLTTSHILA
jgi:hypothetical protein